MNKKATIILISVLIITATGLYLYNNKNKQELNKSNSYEERIQYNNKFAEAGGITINSSDQGHEVTENAGGFTDIQVENRTALLKVMDIDGLLATDKKLSDAFKIMNGINAEINKLQEKELEEYYKVNFDKFVSILGIDSFDNFKEFLSELQFLKDTSIAKALTEENSVTKKGNVIDYTLRIDTSNGAAKTFKIRTVITLKDKKSDALLYWK